MTALTTTQVLKRFPSLSRDLLYFWLRRGWIHPDSEQRGIRKTFSDLQIKKIEVMLREHQNGVPSGRAAEIAASELGEPTVRADRSVATAPLTKPRAMLVIEDNPVHRHLIQGILEPHFRLYFAATGAEAEPLLNEPRLSEFDAVIVDPAIPAEKDGKALRTEGIRIVMKLSDAQEPKPRHGVLSTDVNTDRTLFEERGVPYREKTDFRHAVLDLTAELIPSDPALPNW